MRVSNTYSTARFWSYHFCPDKKVGRCLGTEGNGVSSGEGGERRPGLPGSREDKQSTPRKEGGNMEKEEEGRASWAW